VKPTEVIEKMKAKTIYEANERVKTLSDLKGTQEYTDLEQLHNSRTSPIKSTEITGSLKGRSNVLSRIRDLLDSSEKEVFICTSLEDFEDKSRVLVPAIEKLNNANIKLKLALSGDSEKIKRINSKYNLKAKKIDSNAKFFITDKKEVLFMITPDNSEEEMGIWLSTPYFTESLYSIVDHAFKNSKS